MEKTSRVYVARHEDMVGAAIVRALRREGCENIILRDQEQMDLSDEKQVGDFFKQERPEYVFCFAGPHGGICHNVAYPADLIYLNLKIQCAVIHSAYKYGVKKLLFMAGSCGYPRESRQPIREDYFMEGKMEPTSIAYSTAKAAGIEMCQAYNRQYGVCFVPVALPNYYGAGDDYSDNGHVLAGVLRKIAAAAEDGSESVILWGTGEPKRQFMYVDDLADAVVLIMNRYQETALINAAGGYEFTIAEMAEKIKEIAGYKGFVVFDISKPDGAARKLLDHSKLLSLGFREKISFDQGLRLIYEDYMTTFTGKGGTE
ncbi:MAG: GDP-L-fucose synthase [Peptococcaceae bacterium]|jgi:GDP-L-fucose synthase|nr:GDP-L-fucose synthase [Peptococcaceae bacterium]